MFLTIAWLQLHREQGGERGWGAGQVLRCCSRQAGAVGGSGSGMAVLEQSSALTQETIKELK